MSTLSVTVITKNEEHNIAKCLESIKFADEIIVLDSGSTDKTVEIARQFTPHVFETDWPGFGPQKNRAIEKATSDWILSIDADEHLSPESQKEIQKVIGNKEYDGYELPFVSYYCGTEIKHGDWGKDYAVCLFKKNKGHFSNDQIHEKLIIDGNIGRLKHHAIHDSFKNFEEVLDKVNQYSTLSAMKKHQQGKKSSLKKAIGHGLWTFFRGYILKGGFLDGRKGFMLAVSNAEGTYYRYAKLAELNDKKA